MRKFVGTIIDESYYQEYMKEDKYGNIVHKRMCRFCDEPIEVWAERKGSVGKAVYCFKHICEGER